MEGLTDEQAGQWLRVTWYLLLLVFHAEADLATLSDWLRIAATAKDLQAVGISANR